MSLRTVELDYRLWERHNSERTQSRIAKAELMAEADEAVVWCTICGRKLNPTTAWSVHIVNGGDSILHPEDEPAYKDDGGDMGCWHLGADCAKSVPMEFRVKYQPFEF
jgi:hypothetical protein